MGPVHSTDEASKIGIMVGYMIPIIPSSVINFAADTHAVAIKNLIAAIFIGVILPQYFTHVEAKRYFMDIIKRQYC